MKNYFRLNPDVYRSPMKRIVQVLNLVQGPEVLEWVRHIGEWYDQLDHQVNDVPDTWNQFKVEFHANFQDTQQKQKACMELECH